MFRLVYDVILNSAICIFKIVKVGGTREERENWHVGADQKDFFPKIHSRSDEKHKVQQHAFPAIWLNNWLALVINSRHINIIISGIHSVIRRIVVTVVMPTTQ